MQQYCLLVTQFAHTTEERCPFANACLANAGKADGLAVVNAFGGLEPHSGARDHVGDTHGDVVVDVPPNLAFVNVVSHIHILSFHCDLLIHQGYKV